MLFRHLIPDLLLYIETGDDCSKRVDASSTLALEFLKTGDAIAGKAIATIVNDESCSNALRMIAYLNLLEVSTVPYDEYPDMSTFRFPDDVDWDLVKYFSGTAI